MKKVKVDLRVKVVGINTIRRQLNEVIRLLQVQNGIYTPAKKQDEFEKYIDEDIVQNKNPNLNRTIVEFLEAEMPQSVMRRVANIVNRLLGKNIYFEDFKVSKLTEFAERDFLAQTNYGKICHKYLKKALHANGLKFKNEV